MVSVRSTSQSGTSDSFGSSCTIPVPAGAVSGDIVVLLLEQWESGNPVVTWPSGFQATQLFEIVSGSQKFKGNWKRLTASDAGNYVPSWVGSQWNMGHAVCIQGALASGDPIDDVDTATVTSANESSISNTLATVALQVHAIAKENAQLQSTNPTGFTEQRDGDYLTTNTRVAPGTGSQSASGGILAGSTLQLGVLIGIKPAAGGGSTDLLIADARHTTTSDNIAITQVHNLVVNDARSTSVADNITITQVHQLNIQETRHVTVADTVFIGQNHFLIVQDTVHETKADHLSLTGLIDLAIHKAVQATRSDNIDFTQVHQLVIHKSYLRSLADIVVFLGEGGDVVSVTDVQVQKMATLTGKTGSIQDLEHAYYGSLSGLAPAGSFSVSDHQRVYWETQTGLSARSLADLEKAFYDAQLVPSGSLADRELVYWSGL